MSQSGYTSPSEGIPLNAALVVLSLHVCFTDVLNSSPLPTKKVFQHSQEHGNWMLLTTSLNGVLDVHVHSASASQASAHLWKSTHQSDKTKEQPLLVVFVSSVACFLCTLRAESAPGWRLLYMHPQTLGTGDADSQ